MSYTLFAMETEMGFEELNGAEIDVLYKLYHYGSQEDGNLPSKAGMSGLIGKGLAVKDYDFRHGHPNRLTIKGYAQGHARYD